MERQYKTRRHLKYIRYSAAAFFIIIILIMWLAVFILGQSLSIELVEEFRLGALLGTLIFSADIIVFIYLSDSFSSVTVLLAEKKIVYKSRRKTIEIVITDIDKLKFFSVKFLGGWIRIFSKDKSIRLTISAENFAEFIRNLKVLLDANEKNDVYEVKKFFKLYKTAEFAEQSWERLISIFAKLCLAVVVNLMVGAVLALILSPGIKGWILLMGLSLIGPLLTYSASDYFFARRIEEGSKEESFSCPPRNLAFEGKVYKAGSIIYLAIYLTISLIVSL